MTISLDFQKDMALKSDEELFEIVHHEQDYVSAALDAARKELQDRNLTQTRIQELDALSETSCAQQSALSQKPLSWLARGLIFFLTISIFSIAGVAIYAEGCRNGGHIRKYQESWKWVGYGVAFWILLGVLTLIVGFVRGM